MTYASGISVTPRLSRSSYHASGGNVNGTSHEIEQPRCANRVYRYHVKSRSCQWHIQENDNSTSHYSISTTSACARILTILCQRCPCVRVDANWVIDRLPVTHSGRSDAQGLRSVNTIFRHHDRMSHRPKCLFTDHRCCPRIFSLYLCEASQHIKLQQWWHSSHRKEQNKVCEVKPCDNGWFCP